ncbi:MAG TPA: type II toxin-antitoxin system RelE/ParE family toxin [Burkholderiales bacterium]|nr:type II toxin-antitoxin system RelE/ParE family toxin [Burkholderiales bacterium]
MKPVAWVGDSRERLKQFPAEARHDAGYQLELVQGGASPKDWKPLPSIGMGVNEVRVRAAGSFRLIYVAKFPEAVYVLHAFEKKSRKTPKGDVVLARSRFQALLATRQQA